MLISVWSSDVCSSDLSSAYEYRRTGRGGQGLPNIDNIRRNAPVVASFQATQGDQLMLVTNQAKFIRMPLDSFRVSARGPSGLRRFNLAERKHLRPAVLLGQSA